MENGIVSSQMFRRGRIEKSNKEVLVDLVCLDYLCHLV